MTGACGNDGVDHPLRLDHRHRLRGRLGPGPRRDSPPAAQGRSGRGKLEGELGGDGMVPCIEVTHVYTHNIYICKYVIIYIYIDIYVHIHMNT